MDLSTIMDKVDAGEYLCWEDFRQDLELIVSNAEQYNPGGVADRRGAAIIRAARSMRDIAGSFFYRCKERLGESLFRRCDNIKRARTAAQVPTASNPSTSSATAPAAAAPDGAVVEVAPVPTSLFGLDDPERVAKQRRREKRRRREQAQALLQQEEASSEQPLPETSDPTQADEQAADTPAAVEPASADAPALSEGELEQLGQIRARTTAWVELASELSDGWTVGKLDALYHSLQQEATQCAREQPLQVYSTAWMLQHVETVLLRLEACFA